MRKGSRSRTARSSLSEVAHASTPCTCVEALDEGLEVGSAAQRVVRRALWRLEPDDCAPGPRSRIRKRLAYPLLVAVATQPQPEAGSFPEQSRFRASYTRRQCWCSFPSCRRGDRVWKLWPGGAGRSKLGRKLGKSCTWNRDIETTSRSIFLPRPPRWFPNWLILLTFHIRAARGGSRREEQIKMVAGPRFEPTGMPTQARRTD